MGYRRVDSDPDPDSVRRLTFVPFLENGTCLATPGQYDRLQLPEGDVEPDENWLLDSSRRILMSTANFKQQRVHPFAIDDLAIGLHVYAFAEGAPYRGSRRHTDIELSELTAEELANRLDDEQQAQVVRDAAESFRTQTEQSYHANNIRAIEPAYLRASTAEGGSGMFTATPEDWRAHRKHIVDGIDRDGTFLDLGCANGHLMDSVRQWSAERGFTIEPYGVEVAPGLVELARERLPQWADRIHHGNADSWTHPDGTRFTYVHLLLDYVLPQRRAKLLEHALHNLVEPDGRLLVSHYARRDNAPSVAHEIVEALGFPIAGGSGETVWIDASGDRTSYRRVDSDPDPDSVRRLTFVPFLSNGNCVAIPRTDGGLELPEGDVEAGEDWLLDATLRIPMTTAGYFRQRVHPVATEDVDGGVHLYVFVEGAPYRGEREHREIDLVELTAEELAARLVDERTARVVRDAAESYRTQTEDSYYADNNRLLEPAYLRADTAEGGSGSGSTPEQWRARRGTIVDGIERDGTFLDLGCANGHLMDSIHRWAAERSLTVEPYGLDIAPGLVELARERLPRWADRIHHGNALSWTHPDGTRFTYVHLLLDFVMPPRRTELLEHALHSLVEPHGRLLVSHYVRHEKGQSAAHQIVEALGFTIAGGSGETVWIDAP